MIKEQIQSRAVRTAPSKQQTMAALDVWLADNCVSLPQASTNTRILYQLYYTATWTRGALDYDSFLSALESRGWYLDEDGMIAGVCLASDFLRAVELDASTAEMAVQDKPDPLFACLRQSEAIDLCQTLAAKLNGDLANIEAEFRKSSLYDAETARTTIQAGIDAWFNG